MPVSSTNTASNISSQSQKSPRAHPQHAHLSTGQKHPSALALPGTPLKIEIVARPIKAPSWDTVLLCPCTVVLLISLRQTTQSFKNLKFPRQGHGTIPRLQRPFVLVSNIFFIFCFTSCRFYGETRRTTIARQIDTTTIQQKRGKTKKGDNKTKRTTTKQRLHTCILQQQACRYTKDGNVYAKPRRRAEYKSGKT